MRRRFEGDPVARAAREHPQGLQPLLVIHSEGQPPATIYQSLGLPQTIVWKDALDRPHNVYHGDPIRGLTR